MKKRDLKSLAQEELGMDCLLPEDMILKAGYTYPEYYVDYLYQSMSSILEVSERIKKEKCMLLPRPFKKRMFCGLFIKLWKIKRHVLLKKVI